MCVQNQKSHGMDKKLVHYRQINNKRDHEAGVKISKKRMHGIKTQIIQLSKLKVFLSLSRLDDKQQV